MSTSGSAMAAGLGGAGRLTEVRQRLFFVLGALLIFRIGTFIPVAGVNKEAMAALNEQQCDGILIGRASCRDTAQVHVTDVTLHAITL